MKILFTGGGTGGHFYPVIGIAQAIRDHVKSEKLLPPELFYMSPTPYDARTLFENNITFIRNTAGKTRRYFSLLNFFDMFKTLWGILTATYTIYKIFPDVVFGKGGYASFPPLVAARLLRIPVVIHESDSKPGRVNAWAGKFARRVAVSYPEAARYFSAGKAVYTGNPIRKEIAQPISVGARELLKLGEGAPVVLILGGSQGSKIINETVLDALPELVAKYQIVHQTGKANYKEISQTAQIILGKSPNKNYYRPFEYLNSMEMRMAAGIASVVVTRAGSTIFEIAAWGLPSIIIPIPESVSHDQTSNAFSYARSGAAEVIEENNLGGHILLAEIERIVSNEDLHKKMAASAKSFAHLDAAEKIAREILTIAEGHEK